MRLLVLTPTALRVSPLPLSPARFLPSPLLTLNLLPRLVSHLPSLSPHPSCCPILFHVQLPHSPYLVLLLCIIQLLFCSVRFSQSCLPSFVLSLMELSNLIVLYKSVVLSTLLHSHFLSLFRECNCRYVVAVSQRPLTFPARLFFLLFCFTFFLFTLLPSSRISFFWFICIHLYNVSCNFYKRVYAHLQNGEVKVRYLHKVRKLWNFSCLQILC